MKLLFGRFEGRYLNDVPTDYLIWLSQGRMRKGSLFDAVLEELKKRLASTKLIESAINSASYSELEFSNKNQNFTIQSQVGFFTSGQEQIQSFPRTRLTDDNSNGKVSDIESITNPNYLPQRMPRLADFGLDKTQKMFDMLETHLDNKYFGNGGDFDYEY